jgi:hypothetical protein
MYYSGKNDRPTLVMAAMWSVVLGALLSPKTLGSYKLTRSKNKLIPGALG